MSQKILLKFFEPESEDDPLIKYLDQLEKEIPQALPLALEPQGQLNQLEETVSIENKNSGIQSPED